MPPVPELPKNTKHNSSGQNLKHTNEPSTGISKQAVHEPNTRPATKSTDIAKLEKQRNTGTSPFNRISLKINQPANASETDSQAQKVTVADKPANDFTYERFFEVWKKIALTYKEGSPGLFMAMMKNKPLSKAGGLYEVYTDNAIQRDLFIEKKPEILRALHQELDNYTIDVIPVIKATKKKDIAYLPAEKLQKLIDKNPAVEKMRTVFGLDLEY